MIITAIYVYLPDHIRSIYGHLYYYWAGERPFISSALRSCTRQQKIMLLLPPIQSANYKFLGYWQWRATLSFFPSPGSAAADLGYLVSVLLRRDTVGAIACVVRLSRYL